MTVSHISGHQQQSVTVSAGNEGESRTTVSRGTQGQGQGQRSTTTDGTKKARLQEIVILTYFAILAKLSEFGVKPHVGIACFQK